MSGEKTLLHFEKETIRAGFRTPSGDPVQKKIEIRTNPVTGRRSRITLARQQEKEPGTESLPQPPPSAANIKDCPFCPAQLENKTPQLPAGLGCGQRLQRGKSVLFPNLFPYGRYSAVSLIGDSHFVEIGQAESRDYAECLENCIDYLRRVRGQDPQAVYQAITQNHLPSAGGSLVHPHLQVYAGRMPSNHQSLLEGKAEEFYRETGYLLLQEYLRLEQVKGDRFLGTTGNWHWMAAFAPEGFFEIWGILPGEFSLLKLERQSIYSLARGIINVQRFYRSLNRNGYNLGIIWVENPQSRLELRLVILARSNYAPWVRNDHTGFEIMLGDMATFIPPEETAAKARPYWDQEPP